IDLVEGLKLAEGDAKKVAPVLDQYDLEMDHALQERAKAEEKRSKDRKEPGDEGFSMDVEQFQKDMDEARKDAIHLRDLNRSYESKIDGLLEGDAKAKFDDAVRRRSFARIYSEPQVVKQLKAALKFDDVSGEQKQSITDILAAYERD